MSVETRGDRRRKPLTVLLVEDNHDHAALTLRALKDTGGEKKGDRITHRVEITKLSDIDAEVKTWLKQAYEADA